MYKNSFWDSENKDKSGLWNLPKKRNNTLPFSDRKRGENSRVPLVYILHRLMKLLLRKCTTIALEEKEKMSAKMERKWMDEDEKISRSIVKTCATKRVENVKKAGTSRVPHLRAKITSENYLRQFDVLCCEQEWGEIPTPKIWILMFGQIPTEHFRKTLPISNQTSNFNSVSPTAINRNGLLVNNRSLSFYRSPRSGLAKVHMHSFPCMEWEGELASSLFVP